VSFGRSGPRLTENGLQAARTVMRRHMLTEWMLQKMLSWSKCHLQAHNLEHAISDEIEAALVKEWADPKTCPHGNPLPGHEAAVAGWMPLTSLAVGQAVIIRRIHELAEELPECWPSWRKKGVMPGQRAHSGSRCYLSTQTITLRLDKGEVSLGFAAARYIHIETVKYN